MNESDSLKPRPSSEPIRSADKRLSVFISYSREDLAFADQLQLVLQWQGYSTAIDRDEIHGAENWRDRLSQLILEADVIIFVLSPDSSDSEVCRWEVDEARRHAKRIIPVVCRPLDKATPHPHLQTLNYIYFFSNPRQPGSGFGSGQIELTEALSVDVGWVREHSRIQALAVRWEDDHRPEDQLPRGQELAEFHNWRRNRPVNAPELTKLQRDLLAASDQAEARRSDEEQQRLTAMKRSQEERELAIQEAQRSQQALAKKRKTIFMLSLSFIAGLLVLVFALYDTNLELDDANSTLTTTNQELTTQKSHVATLIQRARIGVNNPRGVSAARKTCEEAVSITEDLARDASQQARIERFEELFFGPMNIIEIWQKTDDYASSDSVGKSSIEAIMVQFKNALDGVSTDNERTLAVQLFDLSESLRTHCNDYLDRLNEP